MSLQDLQDKMDATKAEVAKTTSLNASIVAALDGQTALIQSLKDQIDALPGAGVVTQAELDALTQEASDTLQVAQQNNADLAAKVPQNTSAAKNN